MSTAYLATVLGVESLYPKAQAIEFSYPFDNGIRVMSWDDLMSGCVLYYGDEVDLHFWSLLRMPFGIVGTPSNPLTLQSGYIYEFNHRFKTFDVYNSSNVRIIHLTNISNLAQLNIDFTIMNSHQFHILVASFETDFEFLKVVHWDNTPKLSKVNNIITGGVQNIYIPDRVRPYLPNDVDNPSWNIKYLAMYDELQRWSRSIDLLYERGLKDVYSAIGNYNLINWDKNCPVNYFYIKGADEFQAVDIASIAEIFDPGKAYKPGDIVKIPDDGAIYEVFGGCSCCTDETMPPDSFIYKIKNTKRIYDIIIGKRYYVNDIIKIVDDNTHKETYYLVKDEFVMTDWSLDIINTEIICLLLLELQRIKKFVFFKEHIDLLYMQLAIGMYPDLMPIERYDETQNNRPVYEPWLIWGFYKFLWNKITRDWDEDIPIPLFDLSPSWA